MTASVTKALGLAAFLLITGCLRNDLAESDLYGKYTAKLPDGATERLELLSNNTCFQEIRMRDGTIYRANGTWWYNEELGYLSLAGTRIALESPTVINSQIAQIPSGITGALPVSRDLFGGTLIMLDEGVNYKKE